jgi:ABC-type uncharacterized transport system involved in gliding motility auxiliary subunit
MKTNRREIARFMATIGVALAIAGYLRYSIQGELLLVNKLLLIGGGVLVLGALVIGFPDVVKFFSKRSSKLGTNTAILGIAVIAILVILNYVGYQHHKRIDLTTEKLFTLSDQTKQVVQGLKEDVNIIKFAKTADPQFTDLMGEYEGFSKHIKAQTVDPQEKPDVAKDYGVTHMGDIVVAAGTRKEPITGSAEGGVGEEDVTSAILKVTKSKVKTVCFVTGHGEKSPMDSMPTGYSDADAGLKKEGYTTKVVNLISGNGVPSDCDVLVIAGPTQPLFPAELMDVQKYLAGGGKALIEVDPDTDPKLNDIFSAWNISVGANVVIDASGMGQLLGAGPAIPLVADYGDSPITRTLARHMTFYPLARTVSIADKAKSVPLDVELLKTSERSFTTPKLEHEVKYDAKTDQMGPLSLAVAGSNDEQKSRLVVIGDSDFASNQAVGQASNGDLFYNTIDWLAQDENLISIRPKAPTSRQVTLTLAQRAGLQWLDLIFLPGIVILTGVAIWWKRR